MTKPEDFKAIDELENGSDRVVGIVAGAIVDSRLSEMLSRDLKPDDSPYASKVRYGLLNPEQGALGAFAPRVDLAYLMGYFTPDAHHDLKVLAKIRNAFAHRADDRAFDSDRARSLCSNFKLIDRRVFESSSGIQRSSGKFEHIEAVGSNGKGWVSLQLIDAKSLLATPKGRFICTAKIFCAAFEIYSEGRSEKPIT